MSSSRVVVITGASSGIGAAIASRFAAKDCCIALHGHRNIRGLQRVARDVQLQGSSVRCWLHDLSDASKLESLTQSIFQWQHRVDVWINAAGADVLTGAAKHSSFAEKLETLFAVDLRATMMLSRAIAIRMKTQSIDEKVGLPTIINVGWDQAEQGMEGDSGQYFSAIKGAIMAFSKSLAKTVGPKVRVNCIAPGWIQTAWGQTASESWQKRAIRESCLERWGRPEDIANAAFLLASAESEFINGQTIPVNGGWRARS